MNRNHERLLEQWPTKAWVFSWQVGQHVRTDDRRCRADQGDASEIIDWVEAQTLVEDPKDRVARIGEEQRVAVCPRS